MGVEFTVLAIKHIRRPAGHKGRKASHENKTYAVVNEHVRRVAIQDM